MFFLRKEHPSVSLARPPVGWATTLLHPEHRTTVWACAQQMVSVRCGGGFITHHQSDGDGEWCGE